MATKLELRKIQNELMIRLINSKSEKNKTALRNKINANEHKFEQRFGYRCISVK